MSYFFIKQNMNEMLTDVCLFPCWQECVSEWWVSLSVPQQCIKCQQTLQRLDVSVFLWQYTEKEGLRLGLVGWVKNTSRGTVVGQIQGPAHMVEDMWVQNWTVVYNYHEGVKQKLISHQYEGKQKIWHQTFLHVCFRFIRKKLLFSYFGRKKSWMTLILFHRVSGKCHQL